MSQMTEIVYAKCGHIIDWELYRECRAGFYRTTQFCNAANEKTVRKMPLPDRPYCRGCSENLRKAVRDSYELRKESLLTQARALRWSTDETDHAIRALDKAFELIIPNLEASYRA